MTKKGGKKSGRGGGDGGDADEAEASDAFIVLNISSIRFSRLDQQASQPFGKDGTGTPAVNFRQAHKSPPVFDSTITLDENLRNLFAKIKGVSRIKDFQHWEAYIRGSEAAYEMALKDFKLWTALNPDYEKAGGSSDASGSVQCVGQEILVLGKDAHKEWNSIVHKVLSQTLDHQYPVMPERDTDSEMFQAGVYFTKAAFAAAMEELADLFYDFVHNETAQWDDLVTKIYENKRLCQGEKFQAMLEIVRLNYGMAPVAKLEVLLKWRDELPNIYKSPRKGQPPRVSFYHWFRAVDRCTKEIKKLAPDEAWKDKQILELVLRKLDSALGDPEMQIGNSPIITALAKFGAAIRESKRISKSESPPGTKDLHSLRDMLREIAASAEYKPELERVASELFPDGYSPYSETEAASHYVCQDSYDSDSDSGTALMMKAESGRGRGRARGPDLARRGGRGNGPRKPRPGGPYHSATSWDNKLPLGSGQGGHYGSKQETLDDQNRRLEGRRPLRRTISQLDARQSRSALDNSRQLVGTLVESRKGLQRAIQEPDRANEIIQQVHEDIDRCLKLGSPKRVNAYLTSAINALGGAEDGDTAEACSLASSILSTAFNAAEAEVEKAAAEAQGEDSGYSPEALLAHAAQLARLDSDDREMNKICHLACLARDLRGLQPELRQALLSSDF
mmetsp:Transcript_28384/g.85650  ORF Transcript_28384/g.85650 Transcript_28384/m.85650 type:complete len:677 (-) Transcript_28384:66-2096(-)